MSMLTNSTLEKQAQNWKGYQAGMHEELHQSKLFSQVRCAYRIAEVGVLIQQWVSHGSLLCSAWVSAALRVRLLLHLGQLQDQALSYTYQGSPAIQELHVN